MNRHYRPLLALLALLLLCGCAGKDSPPPDLSGSGAASQSSAQDQEEPVFVSFEGADLEGNPVSQDIFAQSRLTMVNVWATYCNPCLNEMPGLGELAAEFDPSDFQIIGIVSDVRAGEDQTLVERLIQQTGADYPHLLVNDSIHETFLAGVSSVPTTFFFDGEGAYLGGIVGAAEKETWEELIHELLAET